jgi:hypothetical protein
MEHDLGTCRQKVENTYIFVGFEVLTALLINAGVFRDMPIPMPSQLLQASFLLG